MLKHHQTLVDSQQTFCQPGRLEWIGLRSACRRALRSVEQAELREGTGIAGDHHASLFATGKRQVPLIQAEHLPVIAALCHREMIDPALLRRNLVISRINLYGLKDKRFRLGNAILEGTGHCHPCSRMDENLDPGATMP